MPMSATAWRMSRPPPLARMRLIHDHVLGPGSNTRRCEDRTSVSIEEREYDRRRSLRTTDNRLAAPQDDERERPESRRERATVKSRGWRDGCQLFESHSLAACSDRYLEVANARATRRNAGRRADAVAAPDGHLGHKSGDCDGTRGTPALGQQQPFLAVYGRRFGPPEV
jgi:hypothetical protein